MLRYTARALLVLIPALLLAHLFGFAFGHLVAPLHAQRSPLSVGVVDRTPLLERYLGYLQTAGPSLGPLAGSPGDETLAQALGAAVLNSLGLLAIAMLLSVVAGVALGLAAVRTDPPRIAGWLTGAATLGLAIPPFFFGVLGVTLVIMLLIWAPGQFLLLPLEGYGWGRHLVLPVLALMLRPTAQIAQVTAGMLATELGRPYVVTARSLGIHERRIARRHVLRNALPSVISTIAASLRLSAGELIIVENLFYWPGLGRLLALALIPANSSIRAEGALFLNPPLLGAALACLAALFLLVNLGAGLAVRALDPRVR
jgi:peptide/nickel transport system permease protein